MKRRKSKGPWIMGRYDPAAEVQTVVTSDEGEVRYVSVSVRGTDNTLGLSVPSPEQVAAQRNEPVNISGSHWLYHDYWVEMEDARSYRADEVALLIKRVVLREERELALVRHDVDTLERFGALPLPTRELIPDDVRIFVWQRDGGKCVRCGSREKLEFDHIIPVADGGSSTERNVSIALRAL